jgi:hypothetical protein
MKKSLVALMLLLTGCSMNHNIKVSNEERPAVVTMSAYTPSGCLDNLRTEAAEREWKIKAIERSFDFGGLAAELILFPFVKGMSCSAYILAGDVPAKF